MAAWAIGSHWGPQPEADSLAALHRALDLGLNFIDTAAGYGNGRSEKIITQVLAERRAAGKGDPVFVATKTPPAAVLIKEAIGIKKGSGEPHINKVGKISAAQIREIAEKKMPDLNANDLDAASKIIAGTARNMGIEVVD